MSILFVDETKDLGQLRRFDTYENFRNGIGSFFFGRADSKAIRPALPIVQDLYHGLESLISDRLIDPTLYVFQADVVVYKRLGKQNMSYALEVDAGHVYYLIEGERRWRWSRPDSLFEYEYFAGIDICTTKEEWEIAREIARSNGITLTSWRMHHSSMIKNVKDLKDADDILHTVRKFSDAHDKTASAITTLSMLAQLYPK